MDGPCCGSTFDGIQGYGSKDTSTGGYPLWIKSGRSIVISNSTFNGQGTGKNAIKIGGGSSPQDILFINTYMEKYIADVTIPFVNIGADAWNVQFIGGMAVTSCSTSCNQVVFENHSDHGVTINRVATDAFTTQGVHDLSFHGGGFLDRTFATDGYSIPYYSTGPADVTQHFLQGLYSDTVKADGNITSAGGYLVGGAGFRLGDASGTNGQWTVSGPGMYLDVPSGDDFHLRNGGFAERMTILDNGNVGFNSTSPHSRLSVGGLPVYANNAAAITGGLAAGDFYRTGADPDPVMVVH
jgi:hypothetical protein